MTEPLWSDKRIRDRYHALVPSEADMGEMEYWDVLRDVGERVSYELRDEYESTIAALISDSNRIFDRAATRLAEIYGLRAELAVLRQENEVLRANTDPELLTIAYGKGVTDEKERSRKRIGDLEAQLAQTWQPLPDGEVSAFCYVDNGGKLLGVFAGDDYTDWYATEDLPDNIRLCRQQEADK